MNRVGKCIKNIIPGTTQTELPFTALSSASSGCCASSRAFVDQAGRGAYRAGEERRSPVRTALATMDFSPGESQAIELSGEDPPRPSGAEAGPESRDTEHSAGDVKMQELPADENAPRPWPLPDNPQETAGTTRKPLRSSAKSTQKKLFEYPRTPVSAVKPLSSTSDDESDDDHDHKWSMHRASGSRTEKSTTSKDAKKVRKESRVCLIDMISFQLQVHACHI